MSLVYSCSRGHTRLHGHLCECSLVTRLDYLLIACSMALYPPEILNYAIRANGYTVRESGGRSLTASQVKQYCNAIPA